MSIDVLGTLELGSASQEDIRKVSLLVCGKARDKEDAIYLMRMLGLIANPDAKPVHHVVKLGPVSTRKNRRTT